MIIIAGLVAFKLENTDVSAKHLDNICCLTTQFKCIDTVGEKSMVKYLI